MLNMFPKQENICLRFCYFALGLLEKLIMILLLNVIICL